MGNWCSRGPKTQILLQEAIESWTQKHDLIVWACLISDDGKLIVAATSRDKDEKDDGYDFSTLLPLINAYRKSSALFGQTLQHYESKSMHIRTQQLLFSSYTVARYTLNLFTEAQLIDEHSSIEIIDTKALDDIVEKEISVRIREILDQAAQTS